MKSGESHDPKMGGPLEMARGEVWWADLPPPRASEPGFVRPVVIIQSDDVNRSALRTVVAVMLTSNPRYSQAPGNVLIPARKTGLPRDSVANVTQIMTIGKEFLRDPCGKLDDETMEMVEDGLRLVLALP